MDAQTCILTRRSVRKFTDESVSRELLEKVVALAAYAPSWKNTQISRYLAIEDPAVQNTIAEEYCLAGANNPSIIKGAPPAGGPDLCEGPLRLQPGRHLHHRPGGRLAVL